MPSTYTESILDYLFFDDRVPRSLIANPNGWHQTVTATVQQTITFVITKNFADNIELVETIKANVIKQIRVTDTITIDDENIADAHGSKTYSSNVAQAEANTNQAIKNYAAGLTKPDLVTFTFTGNTLRSVSASTIQIRKPEYSDKDSYEALRIKTESRGRNLIIYKDVAWPSTEIFELEFKNLTAEKTIEILSFLSQTTGEKITYIDYHGRSWNGFILNPDTTAQQSGKKTYHIKIQFQVIL